MVLDRPKRRLVQLAASAAYWVCALALAARSYSRGFDRYVWTGAQANPGAARRPPTLEALELARATAETHALFTLAWTMALFVVLTLLWARLSAPRLDLRD